MNPSHVGCWQFRSKGDSTCQQGSHSQEAQAATQRSNLMSEHVYHRMHVVLSSEEGQRKLCPVGLWMPS